MFYYANDFVINFSAISYLRLELSYLQVAFSTDSKEKL